MNRLLVSCVLHLVPCTLCLVPGALYSQQFGGNPPSLHWKQINSDTARIIFPAGLASQAPRAASIVHHLAAQPSTPGHAQGSGISLGNKLYKINIVLQNQTIVSNAYVA